MGGIPLNRLQLRSDKQCWADLLRMFKDWRWWRYMWNASTANRIMQFRLAVRPYDTIEE